MKGRIMAAVIAMLLMAGAAWGAGRPDAETTEVVKTEFENSWENYKSEPITLTVFADDPNFDSATFNVGGGRYDTKVMQYTREDTGVTLSVRDAPDRSEQALNLLIASGDYPDIMFVSLSGHPQPALSLIENDQIWAFEDLKEKYQVDVIRHMNVNQRFSVRARFMKDKSYYATTYGLTDEQLNSEWAVRWQIGAAMNKKLYGDVGSPPIKSFQDLFRVAEAIRAKEPRVEFPIMPTRSTGPGAFNEPAEFTMLQRYYGLNDPRSYWKVGGGHKFYFQAPAFMDLLKDFNEMVNRELINPINWTGSKSDKWDQMMNGSAAIELDTDADNMERIDVAIRQKFPNESYIMMPPFGGRPQYKFTATGEFGAGGGSGWCIPKGGKNTLRAAAFVDYLMSDAFQKMQIYGREGQEHDMVGGVPVLKQEIKGMGDGTDITLIYGFNLFGGGIRSDYWQMIRRQQDLESMARAMKVLRPVIDGYRDLTFVAEAASAPYPVGSEELKVYSNIKETFGDELTRIVQGPPARVEADYKALLAKVEGMGLPMLNAFQEKIAKDFAETVKKYKK